MNDAEVRAWREHAKALNTRPLDPAAARRARDEVAARLGVSEMYQPAQRLFHVRRRRDCGPA